MLLFLSVHLVHALAWLYMVLFGLVVKPSVFDGPDALTKFTQSWDLSRGIAAKTAAVYGLDTWVSLLVETCIWATIALAASRRRQ